VPRLGHKKLLLLTVGGSLFIVACTNPNSDLSINMEKTVEASVENRKLTPRCTNSQTQIKTPTHSITQNNQILPFTVVAPWEKGQTWVAGGGYLGGDYYGERLHKGIDNMH